MTQSELPPSMLCEAAVLLHEEEEEGGDLNLRGDFFSTQGGRRGEEGEGLGRVNIHGGFGRRKKRGPGDGGST